MTQGLAQVNTEVSRWTTQEANGVPSPGSSTMYVTESLIKIDVAPMYEDGTKHRVKNAKGVTCVAYDSNNYFHALGLTIQLCTPDPELVALMVGSVLTDSGRKGWAGPTPGEQDSPGISIEAWELRVDGQDVDDEDPYGWWVYPKVKHFKLGSYSHLNGHLLPSFTAVAYRNANWFDGPLNDWPVASDEPVQWMPFDAKPTAAVGYQTLAAS